MQIYTFFFNCRNLAPIFSNGERITRGDSEFSGTRNGLLPRVERQETARGRGWLDGVFKIQKKSLRGFDPNSKALAAQQQEALREHSAKVWGATDDYADQRKSPLRGRYRLFSNLGFLGF